MRNTQNLLSDFPSDYERNWFTNNQTGFLRLILFADNRALMVEALNESSNERLKEFSAKESEGLWEGKDVHPLIVELLKYIASQNDDFQFEDDPTKVYWEKCISEGQLRRSDGLPDKPIRSFELLKRWFGEYSKSRLAKEFGQWIDSSEDSESGYIKDLMQSEVDETETIVKSIKEGKDFASAILSHKQETQNALGKYGDWLKTQILEKDRTDTGYSIESQIESTSSWSIAKKLILLNELGVLDHIRGKSEYGMSDNQLAKILSKLINGGVSTIASNISAINHSRRQNPYNTSKNVEDVKDFLLENVIKPFK